MSDRVYYCPICGGKYSEGKLENFDCKYCFHYFRDMNDWKHETIFKSI
jgi:hypothetical protein